MTNEIITFQFGNYSNFIGSHYWNIQENQFVYSTDGKIPIPDVNHDVLFREEGNMLTYTPRLILFDLKDNVNVFRRADPAIANQKDVEWKGKVEVFQSKHSETSKYIADLELHENDDKNLKNKFETFNMDDQVKYWTDYSRVKYHDRSMLLSSDYQAIDENSEPFDLYSYGHTVFDKNLNNDFEENLRHYAEECDHIQGFQFLVDAYNGFGGLCSRSLDLINEEYPKRSIFSFLSFPFYNERIVEQNNLKLINTAFTLKNLLLENTDMVVVPLSLFDSFYLQKELKPIKIENVNYQPDLSYHTSAILASLIDTATLPWRQRSQVTHMADIVDLLDVYKHKIASLQAVYPLDIEKQKYLLNYLQEIDLLTESTSFTPLCNAEKQNTNSSSYVSGAMSIFCKGINDVDVKNPKDTFVFRDIEKAFTILDRYCMDMYPKSNSKCFSTTNKLNIEQPYPNIIDKSVFDERLIKKSKKVTREISYLTILEANKNVNGLLKHIESSLTSLDLNKQSKYFENGMEHEDFIELINFQKDLTDMYSV